MHVKAAPFFPEFFGHPKERKRDHQAKRGFSRICFLVRLWGGPHSSKSTPFSPRKKDLASGEDSLKNETSLRIFGDGAFLEETVLGQALKASLQGRPES